MKWSRKDTMPGPVARRVATLGRCGAAALALLAVVGCMAPTQQAESPARPPAEASNEAPAPVPVAVAPPADEPAPSAAHAPEAMPTQGPEATVDPRLENALTRSLAYLERDGGAWMRGESPLNTNNGCISCHVVGFALWSHNAAAAKGLTVNTAEMDRLTAEAMEFIARPGIGRAVTWSQLLLGRSSRDGDTQHDWRAMVDGTMASQENAGHWRARGQFPTQKRPVPESDAVATMWSLLALDSISRIEASDDGAREKALAWLRESATGVSSEWLAMRLLTAQRHGDLEAADRLTASLLAEQRADGGWSWLLAASSGGETDPSNAYSTGVALYALRRAGVEPSDPAVLAAVGYLLDSQLDDGTWQTASRLISAEPDEAKDYIYEYWGTAWAAIGLAEMLEPVDSDPVA